jgi:UDP-N-acetylmuramoyl-tripeptide--D-alanyl-D-alanine ligase
MKYTLAQIAEITKGKLVGNANAIITSIITDSRKISVDDNSIFIALNGKNHDGHNFIEIVYNTHTKNFLVEKLPQNYKNRFPEANFIVVKNSLEAFHKWAAHYRNKFSYPVIGITGSNGKTIVKEWLYQTLMCDYNIIRSPKSYNSQIGVPLSVFLMKESHNLAIFEAGISQEKEMAALAQIINPTIGIITNIGDAHQKNFPDLKTKLNEKLKLFINSDVIIYNKDYQIIDDTLSSLKIFEGKTLFTWSTKFTADVNVIKRTIIENHTDITVSYNNQTFNIQIPFTDYASFENAMHVATLMLHLGYSFNTIEERLKKLSPIATRLELKSAINNCSIINDYYNSDINSISIALDFLATQNQHPTKTLILSDVLQSGKDEFSLYKEIAQMVNKKGVTKFIGIGHVIKI